MRVVRVNLLLAVTAAALAMAAPAHASAPISAHAMVHTCCTPKAEQERIFGEAADLGAEYIRVDVELSGIFKAPGDDPDWSALDEVMELSKQHHLRVLAILIVPHDYTNADEFGLRSGEVAEHAGDAITHWEILNEPDGDWAWGGTAEEYARMLSAAHDAIKAKAPGDQIVLGGLMKPHEPGWLQRVFDTPGADALHKFDIANIHMRGPLDAVLRRYGEFKALVARAGFSGPLWVTELGYPADPAYQSDPTYSGGDASQAAYLTQALVGLGELGAPEVFVTLHDGSLDGKYATEGLEHIDETPGGDYPMERRPAFAAVRRVVTDWDQLMAWRAEQRDQEQEQRVEQGKAAICADEARAMREKVRAAIANVQAAQRGGIGARLDRARALLAGARTAFLWKRAVAGWYSHRADDHAAAALLLKVKIAGG
ncbi:MAG TPA: hypothetical protein VF072_00290 [Thermoleophilaceae bacterium]